MTTLRRSTRIKAIAPVTPATPIKRPVKRIKPAGPNPMLVEAIQKITEAQKIRDTFHAAYDPSNPVHQTMKKLFEATDALIEEAELIESDEEFLALGKKASDIYRDANKCTAWEHDQSIIRTIGDVESYCGLVTDLALYFADDEEEVNQMREKYRARIIELLIDFKIK